MKPENIEEIITKFEKCFDEYHVLFLENYPLPSKRDDVFGSREMNELGMKCQAYISMLGETPKTRMVYVGFNQFFAFDNPVDWYNWKTQVGENKVDPTIYFSISLRLDIELKRMRFFLKENMWGAYCNLSDNEYSTSYLSYEAFQSQEIKRIKNIPENMNNSNHPNISITVNNHPEKNESKVFSRIEDIDKKTSIMRNIAAFVSQIAG